MRTNWGTIIDTISELNLNCNRLKDARRMVWDLLSESERRGDPADDLMHDYLMQDRNGRLFRFFTTISSYFAPDAEEFLRRNAP